MHKVYFVGCGPGDPELITIKAKKLLQKAGVVVYSGSLIPDEIIKLCKNAKMYDASGMVRQEIFEILKDGAINQKLVVRLHDGDPAVFSTIREQIDELKKHKIHSIVVPGVSSFLAASAALGIQLTLPGVTQTIIITRAEKRTKVPPREQICQLAKHGSTMVFYLSVHLLRDIVREAIKGGYGQQTPVAVVYRASWPDQKIIRGTLQDIVKKVWEQKITRTAIVIIGDVIEPKSYEFSKLYDETFSHGYRKSSREASGQPSLIHTQN